MAGLRVAVIGARRARQGLGPFIARDLRAAGADVVALFTNDAGSGAEAALQCQRFAGVRPPCFSDPATLLDAARPQALAICSPHETHAAWLDRALAARLHVLCEKPLIWGANQAALSRRNAASFAAEGLVLFENCQWPHTLPAFAALHPGALAARPHSFGMLLQPAARGHGMLADSLPHPLSLLQALVPRARPRADDVRIAMSGTGDVSVRFAYVTPEARVAVALELQPRDTHPRRFRIEIDGRFAERRVDPADYSLRLESDGRSVPLPDPMATHVAEFVACASRGHDPLADQRRDEISARAELLASLLAAWPPALGA